MANYSIIGSTNLSSLALVASTATQAGVRWDNPKVFELESWIDFSIPTPEGGWGSLAGTGLLTSPSLPSNYDQGKVGAAPNSTSALVQNDVVALLPIPAYTYIQAVFWRVAKVEGAARNFSLGDVGDATLWLGSTSANSLAAGVSTYVTTITNVTGTADGKLYTANDALCLKAQTSGGLTTARIYVKALGWRVDYPA